jgi:hypothetical protein
MPLYISLSHSFLPSLFLSTVIILTGLSHSTHGPYIVLPLLFKSNKSNTPTRLIKRGLKQKTTYYNDGGNGDDYEAPDTPTLFQCRICSSESSRGTIIVSLHSALRLPSPQLGLCVEQRFRASYASVHTIKI